MRQLTFAALALSVAFAAGCTGEGVNRANVFKPQGGTIDLNVSNLSNPEEYQSVDFELDGKSLGKDESVADGWSFKFDSTTVPDGIHTVRAIGNTAAGTTVELLNSSLYIQNNGTGASPATSPAPATGGEEPAGTVESGTGAEAPPSAFQRPR